MRIPWWCGLFITGYLGLALMNAYQTDQSWWYRSTEVHGIVHPWGIVGAYSAAWLHYYFGISAWLIIGAACILLISRWYGISGRTLQYRGYRLGAMTVGALLMSTDLAGDYAGGAAGEFLYRCFCYGVPEEYTALILGCGAGMIIIWCGAVQLLEKPLQRMAVWVYTGIMYIMQQGCSMVLKGLRSPIKVSSAHAVHHVNKEISSSHNARVRQPDSAPLKNTKKIPSYHQIFKKTLRAERSALDAVCRAQADLLLDKLLQFGIKGKIVSIAVGPIVVLFEYQPEHNIPLTKIVAREADLALALRVPSIRIIAPIPGKGLVGFECAHTERATIPFAQGIESLLRDVQHKHVPLFFGVTTAEEPVIVDLTALPHLLVAGSTGSGKSVALHAMLMSMLGTRSAQELRLILIDPKRLEFAPYAHIPHLLTPIIHDAQYAISVLRWLVAEMGRRYDCLAQKGYKDCVSYQGAGNDDMPFIVVMIDEWADLMMTGGKNVEALIVRLAQMARAAGIHLIIATQRPSVDVITGLIKVNVPARAAFRVASKIDSRTMLDRSGAEQLLGKGDMLFIGLESVPVRLHGVYVAMKEVEAMVHCVRQQGNPAYINMEVVENEYDLTDEDAALYQQVIELVRSLDEISISLLQRKLKIGYNRSARMIDYLELQGLILPSNGSKMRRVVR